MSEINYHTHTCRCGHASGSDEEYVKCAIQAGYQVLGFSDHAPFKDYSHPRSHMEWEQLDEYIESIQSLKKKYEGIIDIKVGLETEYYPFNYEERRYLKQKVEYLLLGQHFTSPEQTVSYFKENTEEEILTYADSICNAIDTGLFMYVCHPDVFMSRQKYFSAACETAAHKIAKKAAERKIPLEVNVRGVMKGKRTYNDGMYYSYPFRRFWEIAAQYPIQCILGIDAHDPQDLLDFQAIETSLKLLEGLPLHYISEEIL